MAGSRRKLSSTWPVLIRCWSCSSRVWLRPVNVALSRSMLLKTSYSWWAPSRASQSQEKPGSLLLIFSNDTR